MYGSPVVIFTTIAAYAPAMTSKFEISGEMTIRGYVCKFYAVPSQFHSRTEAEKMSALLAAEASPKTLRL
jgi:hypothetical protein